MDKFLPQDDLLDILVLVVRNADKVNTSRKIGNFHLRNKIARLTNIF